MIYGNNNKLGDPMKNLINFFFSFDKLMKEKLVIAFFWLAIIVFSLAFFSSFLSGIKLGPLAWIVDRLNFVASFLFGIVGIRLVCEVAVAIFRINNNLSPDGGKSETADIDPIAETRKAAEAAAAKAREVTKTAGEKASAATKSAVDKTKSAAESAKDSVEDVADAAVSKTKAATSSVAPKKRGRPKGSTNKPKSASAKTSATKTTSAPKKRGRPAGSKTKTTGKRKPGPKPGSKAPRDAQGRLLKKDGTPRKKPGPKKK